MMSQIDQINQEYVDYFRDSRNFKQAIIEGLWLELIFELNWRDALTRIIPQTHFGFVCVAPRIGSTTLPLEHICDDQTHGVSSEVVVRLDLVFGGGKDYLFFEYGIGGQITLRLVVRRLGHTLILEFVVVVEVLILIIRLQKPVVVLGCHWV